MVCYVFCVRYDWRGSAALRVVVVVVDDDFAAAARLCIDCCTIEYYRRGTLASSYCM